MLAGSEKGILNEIINDAKRSTRDRVLRELKKLDFLIKRGVAKISDYERRSKLERHLAELDYEQITQGETTT